MTKVTEPYREVVVIDGLTVAYGDRVVLDKIDLTVASGEVVAVMGPSGSGKSTLLNCVAGLQEADSGTVRVAGRLISGREPGRRAKIRRELIGLTLQTHDLLPELSIEENVAITLLFEGMRREESLARAWRSLDAVGLGRHATKRTDEVSGGEAQRVAIARALVRPSVALLVADEPTASLDAANAVAVADLITERVRTTDIAGLVATHDNRVAERCDRIWTVRETVHR